MGSVDIYPPSAPSGMALAYAEVTANQTGITSETDLTGLTVTVTVPAGRRIKITGSIFINRTVADGVTSLKIKEGATQLHQADGFVRNAAEAQFIERAASFTPTAGTHTYKLTLTLTTGTGSTGLIAGATFPAYILVEDVTGTIYPAGTLVTAGIIASEAWTDWVPTLTNLTLGNGSVDAKFIKLGRTVFYRFLFTLGTTSAVGTNPQFTLPVAPVAAWTVPFGIGSVILRDNGTAEYLGTVEVVSGSTVRPVTLGASSIVTTITATVPMTWANTDNIWAYGTYEAAS